MQPLSTHALTRDVVNDCSGSVNDLTAFIKDHPRLFVLTGASISRASGIPTYRDEIGIWKSNTPVQHGEFIRNPAIRKRYWARSFGGWPNVDTARPNSAHHALARLESQGYVSNLVTQNIDRLHQKAGHKQVVDLHGRLDQVLCMDCGSMTPRREIQDWLWQHNPQLEDMQAAIGPDGDAEVGEERAQSPVVHQAVVHQSAHRARHKYRRGGADQDDQTLLPCQVAATAGWERSARPSARGSSV